MIIFLMFLTPLVLYGISDLLPEFKSGNIRVAVVYIAIAVCSVVLCVCVLREVHLTSPNDIVKSIVTAIFPPWVEGLK